MRAFGKRAHRMGGVDAPGALRGETRFERVVAVVVGGRRCGRIGTVGATAAGAETIEELVPENADEPRAQRGTAAEGFALAPRGEEAVLHGFLGFVVVVEPGARVGKEHGGLGEERFELELGSVRHGG